MSAKFSLAQLTVAICAAAALILGLAVAPIMAPGSIPATVVPVAIAVFLGWQAMHMRSRQQREQDQRRR